MRLPLLSLLLLSGAFLATSAHAQSRPAGDRVELPIWNKMSGEIEGIVVLEPTDVAKSRSLARFGVRHLDTTLGLSEGDSLGLLCDHKPGLGSALSSLAANCVLASVPARRTGAAAVFQRMIVCHSLVDLVMGAESRGFIFGTAIAQALEQLHRRLAARVELDGALQGLFGVSPVTSQS